MQKQHLILHPAEQRNSSLLYVHMYIVQWQIQCRVQLLIVWMDALQLATIATNTVLVNS